MDPISDDASSFLFRQSIIIFGYQYLPYHQSTNIHVWYGTIPTTIPSLHLSFSVTMLFPHVRRYSRMWRMRSVGASFRRWQSSAAAKPARQQHKQSSHKVQEYEPLQTVLQLDFFDQPVTFATTRGARDPTLTHAMAALDGHLLAVVSKGRSCHGGGSEEGITVQANHAAALGWAELLRFAAVWQDRAPMLTVTAVAPVLAHTGVAYVEQALDPLLKQARPMAPGLPQLQCIALAKQALQQWEARADKQRGAASPHHPPPNDQDDNDDKQVEEEEEDPLQTAHERERFHMRALQYLLRDEHAHALVVLLKCLQQCPGDALALSLALDLSQTTGQAWAAGQAASAVSAYWYERRGGLIRPSLPGYSLVSAYIALGWAVSGRYVEAEAIADQSLAGKKLSGAVATWALGHVYDATGRISEGISFLANSDGMRNYEGSGWMFTVDRLATYGGRFALDREERGGRVQSPALRLYEHHVTRVLEGSGYAMPDYSTHVRQQAPLGWLDFSKSKTVLLEATQQKKEPSWYDRLFGTSADDDDDDEKSKVETKFEVVAEKDKTPSRHFNDEWTPTAEDVLTFLPPTPIFLAEATILLFRMTLNGTLSRKNERWDQLRNAWRTTVKQHKAAGRSLAFCPLAAVAASMVISPRETGAEDLPSTRALSHGLYRMGQLLQFGRNLNQDDKENENPRTSDIVILDNLGQNEPEFWLPVTDDQKKEWKKVVDTLMIALDGFDEKHDLMDPAQLRFTSAWEMDGRPILEHSVVYAACKAGDMPSLHLARSICSRGVSMRPNSPEEWWRYSIVLGLIGDVTGSENALETSINVGGGQGSR